MSGQSARLSFSVENLLGLRKEEQRNSSQERAVSPEAPLTENDELFDEENQGKLDNHLQNEENHRIRRKRVLFTETQIDILKSVFANQKYLSAESRTKLAESLNLSPKQVKTWFQNYRYKCRRRCYGYGYTQPEDQEILKSHLGTATTMATPVRMSVPHPEGPTVFFGNHHCPLEHYGSTSATHTRYNEHFHPLVHFSYSFPSKYQHLPTYQKHVN